MLTADITAAQLGILDQVYGKENVADIPKMWAMYKEVADYYLEGVSRLLQHLYMLTGH